MRLVDDIPTVVQEAWRTVLGRADLPADADFFELGGSSIHGARLMGQLRAALDVPLPVQLIFFHPGLAEFTAAVGDAAQRSGTGGAGGAGGQAPAGGPGPLGLSLQQEQLWVADQLEPGNLAYTELLPLRLDGPLDVARVQSCLDLLLRRHEALRTRFPAAPDGSPRQEIGQARTVPFETMPLEAVDVADEDAARRVALGRLAQPFDLAAGPLVRAVLLRLADQAQVHVLLLYAHHIVADGLSLAVLCDELADSYAGRALPEPAPSYAAHTRAQATLDLSGQRAYWRDRLAGACEVELPVDRPRPAVRSTAGRRLRLPVPAAVRDAVDGLAREHGATRFMALLAAFHALLGRWSGSDDVTVGSPVSGRCGPRADRLVGYLVNMVALRGDTGGDPTFGELLARTRDHTLGALANADVPFSRVAADLVSRRDRSRPPVFTATIIAQPTPLTLVADLGEVKATSFPVPRQHCTYDLSLYVWDTGDELVLD
ncbi:MAG TPA: condensation domain-containing protein, partial [Pseudonocardiaceae bacterium]|nr:condensation domain-containing protein [Pseudonocardiaceae bacterium]